MLSGRTQRQLEGLETCSRNGKYRCRDLFKMALECRDLWLQAYANIYANSGATAVGSDGVSLDGQSIERIDHLISLLKNNEYLPVPSRRVYIPKANGKQRPLGGRTELTTRMLAKRCEYCGKTEGKFEVHHVRKLRDIKDGTKTWQRLMIARNRKTLVLCVECHDLLHAGKLPDNRYSPRNSMESRVQ